MCGSKRLQSKSSKTQANVGFVSYAHTDEDRKYEWVVDHEPSFLTLERADFSSFKSSWVDLEWIVRLIVLQPAVMVPEQ